MAVNKNNPGVFRAQTVHGVPAAKEGQAQPDAPDFTNTMPMARKQVFGEMVVKRKSYLELTIGDKKQGRLELTDSSLRVGRSPECEIHLALNNISRVHGRFAPKNNDFMIEDMGSTNGCFVNGIRVTRCVLREGDVVEIGEAKFYFYEEKIRQKA